MIHYFEGTELLLSKYKEKFDTELDTSERLIGIFNNCICTLKNNIDAEKIELEFTSMDTVFRIDEDIQAFDQYEGMKPIVFDRSEEAEILVGTFTYNCPRCTTEFDMDFGQHKFCPECGQKLDWSEYNERI